MSEFTTNGTARSEAVQPSLWDRLIDDLPGTMAEIVALREDLTEILGEAEVIKIMGGGATALRRRTDLDEPTKKLAHTLIQRETLRARIEADGVVVTSDVLREAVRRDIEMLFNVERLEADYLLTDSELRRTTTPGTLLADFPEVRRSVVNFGMPSFSGRKGSDFDKDALAREIKSVLTVFEPRLRADTIKVNVRFAEKVGMLVSIDALLMLSPVPERLKLSTAIDLDNGRATTAQEEI